jgi:hypothetical protein
MGTAATGFAGVAALAIAELSTTDDFAACMSCLLCRGLFSCGPSVFVHDNDAWVQRRCPAGRVLWAQLLLDSQVWRRCYMRNGGFCSTRELFGLPRLGLFHSHGV